ncbi:MAG: helix-hairpin-helix domain-containing protein [Acidobacteriota bacterium]|nr:helix-hairpin-helix domain-containing protein [Acidobacteriota bacterium]MDQ5836125.1 helix-hairpin-helix domain-containing protein [Acidobacteriota bacterium]
MKRNLLRRSAGCIILCFAAAAASSSCVKLPRRAGISAAQASNVSLLADDAPRVSLNHSTRAELEKLPGIGPALAARIVEWRERYGPFRRAEHLMLVRGISERLFRQLRPHITLD